MRKATLRPNLRMRLAKTDSKHALHLQTMTQPCVPKPAMVKMLLGKPRLSSLLSLTHYTNVVRTLG